jgi:DNA-binding beta-propeller fold protein YncE
MATVQLAFDVVPNWEQLPASFTHLDVVGIGIDSKDRVYLLTRAQPRVIVYDRDGKYLYSWGDGFFTERTHGLTITASDEVYVVDEGSEVVYRFTTDGSLKQTIGTVGVASKTGYDGRSLDSVRGGGPFNRPTNVAIAPNGDLYVSDGYGNCKVHRFSRAGGLIQSWGEPGTGPGQFFLPHGIAVSADGRVLVADRESDRIQIFSLKGAYQTEWTDVQRPTNVRLGSDGLVYVSELWRPIGHMSYRLGVTAVDLPGRVSVLDRNGRVVARWGGPDRAAAGNFVAPHDIAVDSRGDVYVGEVTETFGVRPGLVAAGAHTFQKFARSG